MCCWFQLLDITEICDQQSIQASCRRKPLMFIDPDKVAKMSPSVSAQVRITPKVVRCRCVPLRNWRIWCVFIPCYALSDIVSCSYCHLPYAAVLYVQSRLLFRAVQTCDCLSVLDYAVILYYGSRLQFVQHACLARYRDKPRYRRTKHLLSQSFLTILSATSLRPCPRSI